MIFMWVSAVLVTIGYMGMCLSNKFTCVGLRAVKCEEVVVLDQPLQANIAELPHQVVGKTRKNSGGLTQLICYGSPDMFKRLQPMYTPIVPPEWHHGACCNSQNEVSTWFIGQESGMPHRDDVYPFVADQALYFSVFPVTVAVCSATRERAACRIQKAWRRAITDPKRFFCQKRLFQEFTELSSPC